MKQFPPSVDGHDYLRPFMFSLSFRSADFRACRFCFVELRTRSEPRVSLWAVVKFQGFLFRGNLEQYREVLIGPLPAMNDEIPVAPGDVEVETCRLTSSLDVDADDILVTTGDSMDVITPSDNFSTSSIAVIAGFLALVFSCLCIMGGPYLLLPPYVVMQLLVSTVAIYTRDWGGIARWSAGLFCTMILSAYKTAIVFPAFFPPGGNLTPKLFAYATSALWECSNAVLVFGGRDAHDLYGLTSYRRVLIAALIPCGVKFVDKPKPMLTARRSGHLLVGILGGLGLRAVLMLESMSGFVDLLCSISVLQAEMMALFIACLLLVFDIPGLIAQLVMDSLLAVACQFGCQAATIADLRVQVVLPYGAVYLSTSSRDFWSKWSRPATQLIRRVVYYPLGGARRPYLSVPVMFVINGSSHYDVGNALVGFREEMAWNVVFWTLGGAALVEMLTIDFMTNRGCFHDRSDDSCTGTHSESTEERRLALKSAEESLPTWFKISQWALAHGSMLVAVHFMVTGCLRLKGLRDML